MRSNMGNCFHSQLLEAPIASCWISDNSIIPFIILGHSLAFPYRVISFASLSTTISFSSLITSLSFTVAFLSPMTSLSITITSSSPKIFYFVVHFTSVCVHPSTHKCFSSFKVNTSRRGVCKVGRQHASVCTKIAYVPHLHSCTCRLAGRPRSLRRDTKETLSMHPYAPEVRAWSSAALHRTGSVAPRRMACGKWFCVRFQIALCGLLHKCITVIRIQGHEIIRSISCSLFWIAFLMSSVAQEQGHYFCDWFPDTFLEFLYWQLTMVSIQGARRRYEGTHSNMRTHTRTLNLTWLSLFLHHVWCCAVQKGHVRRNSLAYKRDTSLMIGLILVLCLTMVCAGRTRMQNLSCMYVCRIFLACTCVAPFLHIRV